MLKLDEIDTSVEITELKSNHILRVICTCCLKGELVVEELGPSAVLPRVRELCLEAGLIEVESMAEEGVSVFVCSMNCARLYKTEVGPFRMRQAKLAKSDVWPPPGRVE